MEETINIVGAVQNPDTTQPQVPSSALDSIKQEIAAITPAEGETHVGMLSIKTANRAIKDAARRPNPRNLYGGLW